MSRERNILQVKEEDKTKQKTKLEISYLPDKEFKVMIIKMFNEFRRRMHEHSEMFNKQLENTKKKQTAEEYNSENKKYALEVINARLDDTEE